MRLQTVSPSMDDTSAMRRRERLSALLDGEHETGRGGREVDTTTTEACRVAWRGYCITRSVLRGEFGSGRVPLCRVQPDELSCRIRDALASDSNATPTAGQTLPPTARRHRFADALRPGINAWRSTLRGRRQRAKAGALVAGSAVACSVALGIGIARLQAPTSLPDVAGNPRQTLPVLETNSPVQHADLRVAPSAQAAVDKLVAVVSNEVEPSSNSQPSRSVPRVVATAAFDGGQLPYYFAHANAYQDSLRHPAMMLIPIAGDDVSSAMLRSNLDSSSGNQ